MQGGTAGAVAFLLIGTVLAGVGLRFIFDADKTVHWIAPIKRAVARFSYIRGIQMAVVLITMLPGA